MHDDMPNGRKVMMLRALKLSGIAALVLAGVSVGSQPADACCNYGYYAPAPVVV
jgi:hypothetical protein